MFPILYTLPSGWIINLAVLPAIRQLDEDNTLQLYIGGSSSFFLERFDSKESMQAELEKIKVACEPKPTQPVVGLGLDDMEE